MKESSKDPASASSGAGNRPLLKTTDLEFNLAGGAAIKYRLSAVLIPKVGSGGIPPVPSPSPFPDPVSSPPAVLLRCPLGDLLHFSVDANVSGNAGKEPLKEVLEQKASLGFSDGLVVAFRVVVMPKHGVPPPLEETPDMRLSCALNDQWVTEITGLVMRTASIVVKGGGTPSVPPPPSV